MYSNEFVWSTTDGRKLRPQQSRTSLVSTDCSSILYMPNEQSDQYARLVPKPPPSVPKRYPCYENVFVNSTFNQPRHSTMKPRTTFIRTRPDIPRLQFESNDTPPPPPPPADEEYFMYGFDSLETTNSQKTLLETSGKQPSIQKISVKALQLPKQSDISRMTREKMASKCSNDFFDYDHSKVCNSILHRSNRSPLDFLTWLIVFILKCLAVALLLAALIIVILFMIFLFYNEIWSYQNNATPLLFKTFRLIHNHTARNST